MVLVALSACGPKLEDARVAWQRVQPRAYVFEYQRNCACPGSGLWYRVTVRDDSVVASDLLESSSPGSPGPGFANSAHPTISQMFDGLAEFQQQPHTWTRIHYDPRWHFPDDARGDATNRMAGSFRFSVRNFHPIP